jgi:hypothetical protein
MWQPRTYIMLCRRLASYMSISVLYHMSIQYTCGIRTDLCDS